MTTESVLMNSSEGKNQKVSDKKVRMCERLKPILKSDYKEFLNFQLLHLIDDTLLTDTPASVVGEMIENEDFSVKEKASLREKRRKLINIKTANKSRNKALVEFEQLGRDITELQKVKEKLIEKKRDLRQEVDKYKLHYQEIQLQSDYTYVPYEDQQLQTLTFGNNSLAGDMNYNNW